jgi:hypothetical protein
MDRGVARPRDRGQLRLRPRRRARTGDDGGRRDRSSADRPTLRRGPGIPRHPHRCVRRADRSGRHVAAAVRQPSQVGGRDGRPVRPPAVPPTVRRRRGRGRWRRVRSQRCARGATGAQLRPGRAHATVAGPGCPRPRGRGVGQRRTTHQHPLGHPQPTARHGLPRRVVVRRRGVRAGNHTCPDGSVADQRPAQPGLIRAARHRAGTRLADVHP